MYQKSLDQHIKSKNCDLKTTHFDLQSYGRKKCTFHDEKVMVEKMITLCIGILPHLPILYQKNENTRY